MPRTKFILYFLLFASKILAQEFEVSPAFLNFIANAGETQSETINIINHSVKPQTYTITISDYLIDSEGNNKLVPAGTYKRSCADWITINPSQIELSPNQSATFETLMTVPKTGNSTKWCAIYIEVVKEQTSFDADKTLETSNQIISHSIIPVKQSPTNNNSYKASISDLKETTKFGDIQRTFEVQVTNLGDNVIDANINLSLQDMKTAKEEKFNPVKVTVYPDTTRMVKLSLPPELAKGKYTLVAILNYGHYEPPGETQLILKVN